MQSKIIQATLVVLLIMTTGCTSSKYVSGQVYSNTGYEMMGKQVSFSEYGFSALDKRTRVAVEKERLKFINEVDDYFTSENGRDVHGILNLYNNDK